jgi:hypothetical protein
VKPYALVPLFLALLAAGCVESELGSDDPAPGLAGAAVAAPVQPGLTGPGAVLPDEATDGATDETTAAAAEAFVAGVDHPYFPLTPGTVWIYVGDDKGLSRRDEVRVLGQAQVIAGVSCTAVMQEVFLDDELAEVTTEWYAQDIDGNLWKFGEQSLEPDANGQFVTTADTWVAGEDGMLPWMFLAADPRVGDVYLGITPEGEEVLQVLSLTETATVPAGSFENCLQIVEDPDDEDDQDIIIYGPGAGLVSEQSTGGRIDLVSIQQE